MKSEWINYKGKRIFLTQCAHLDLDALKKEFDEIEKTIHREPEASVLFLTDVRGFITTPASLDLFKQVTAHLKKYVLKETVVGIKGTKEKFLEYIKQYSGVKPVIFDDIEQAKDWLVKP